MKHFNVRLTALFFQDLERVFDFVRESSPQNAIAVVESIEQSVMQLETMPKIHSKAYESASFQHLDLRQIICKNHRIIYQIENQNIFVLTILNCRQDLLSNEMLRLVLDGSVQESE